MHVDSVWEQKTGKTHGMSRSLPAENTDARGVLDVLMACPGRAVCMNDIAERVGENRMTRVRAVLEDSYGMDIRIARRGNRNGKNRWWILAGEWFGSEYRDYVNEAIDAELAKSNPRSG